VELSGEGRGGRSAVCAGTKLCSAFDGESRGGAMPFRKLSRETDRRGGQGQSGCVERNRIAGKIRAGCGNLDLDRARLRCADHARGHSAMMYTVTAAARGEARIVTGGHGYHQRPQAEEQNHQNGERPPHLRLMLHQIWNMGERRGMRQASVGYHRGIQFSMEFQEG
jgi:hypothetical protein